MILDFVYDRMTLYISQDQCRQQYEAWLLDLLWMYYDAWWLFYGVTKEQHLWIEQETSSTRAYSSISMSQTQQYTHRHIASFFARCSSTSTQAQYFSRKAKQQIILQGGKHTANIYRHTHPLTGYTRHMMQNQDYSNLQSAFKKRDHMLNHAYISISYLCVYIPYHQLSKVWCDNKSKMQKAVYFNKGR